MSARPYQLHRAARCRGARVPRLAVHSLSRLFIDSLALPFIYSRCHGCSLPVTRPSAAPRPWGLARSLTPCYSDLERPRGAVAFERRALCLPPMDELLFGHFRLRPEMKGNEGTRTGRSGLGLRLEGLGFRGTSTSRVKIILAPYATDLLRRMKAQAGVVGGVVGG